MSYNNVALAVIPSGIKSSIVYSLIGGNMTFARGSSATRINKDGLIEYVDTSVPRLDYDGAIPHLLLEPSRSNLQVYSEDLSNAAWNKTNATLTTNAEIAPDGNNTANKLDCGTATGEHHVNDFITTTAGEDYTFSIFVKAGSLSEVRVFTYQSASPFTTIAALRIDLSDGTISENTNTSGTTNKVEALRDGWFRISVSGEALTTGTIVRVQPYKDGASNFAGKNEYIYLWGAQFELGYYVTSYIPRLDATAATRTAETCDSGTVDFNGNTGCLFVELEGLSDIYTANRYITLSDGTTSNMLYIRYSNTGELGITNVGPSLSSSVYSTNLNLSQRHKIAINFGVDTSDYKVYINGSSVTISGSFSAQLMTGLNTLDFSYPTGSLQFYGKVRQAVVFNSALTDSQLAELTR